MLTKKLEWGINQAELDKQWVDPRSHAVVRFVGFDNRASSFDMTTARLYRSVARELARTSTSPRTQRNKDVAANVRRLFEGPLATEHDVANIVTFLRSQREYKALLEKYNPLVELTGEERVAATARRVGLNMPEVV